MHILVLFVVGPILLALAGLAAVALMILGTAVLEFPPLILPIAALAWMLRTGSRRSVPKHAAC